MKKILESQPYLTEARRVELRRLWWAETKTAGARAWRKELALTEQAFVARLDHSYANECDELAEVVMIMDDISRVFPSAHVQQISRRGGHCRLELTDGRVLDCRLESDFRVRYREEVHL